MEIWQAWSQSKPPNCGIISGSSSSPAGLLISIVNGSGGYEFGTLSGELHLSPRLDGVGPRPRANGARDVCVSDSLSNSPLCAVAGCVSRGCLPVTGPVRPMVFHDLANQLVVAAKWSRYLTIPPATTNATTQKHTPVGGPSAPSAAETPISCPEAPRRFKRAP